MGHGRVCWREGALLQGVLRAACSFWWAVAFGALRRTSFSITAIFLPWLAVRMWLRSVVFPLPRYPVKTVTGTRVSGCVSAITPKG